MTDLTLVGGRFIGCWNCGEARIIARRLICRGDLDLSLETTCLKCGQIGELIVRPWLGADGEPEKILIEVSRGK